ncbi:MAG: hypothetical protein GXO92_08290 [FCB group bacterium]|nr:hypothetical protein [FCB group bacterium]
MKKRIQNLFKLVILLSPLLGGNNSVYILHSNNTNGALENCYCPDHPLGSVEKRAVYVPEFIRKHPNTIVVDAGDFFSVTERYPLKDSLITVAYGLIPYDAVLLGDQEVTRNPAFLNRVLPLVGSQFVITNLQSPRFPNQVPYKIVKRGDIRIGILGILGPVAFKYYPKEVRAKISLKAPLVAINEILPEIIEKTDLIIVLSHQGYDQDVRLARKLKNVAVIVGSHSQSVIKEPEQENGILISQAGKDGYYVGVIKIELNDQRRIESKSGYLVPMTLEMPDHPRVMELIGEYEKRSGLVNRNKLKMSKGE